MKEKRLIDADALLENVQYRPTADNKNAEIIDRCVKITRRLIENAPTIEAEPVRHGHWVKCQWKSNIWYCSECGEKINYKQNRRTYNIPKVPVWQKNKRCRRCGAKMGGAEDG